jgi:hypothetical protein
MSRTRSESVEVGAADGGVVEGDSAVQLDVTSAAANVAASRAQRRARSRPHVHQLPNKARKLGFPSVVMAPRQRCSGLAVSNRSDRADGRSGPQRLVEPQHRSSHRVVVYSVHDPVAAPFLNPGA